MSELETEHTYQLRQAEATQAEKLKEVHEGYCAAIEELKEKNEVSPPHRQSVPTINFKQDFLVYQIINVNFLAFLKRLTHKKSLENSNTNNFLPQTMENEHTHEIGMIQQDIAKLRSGHERTLQALEADFNIRLISEYDRYQVRQ